MRRPKLDHRSGITLITIIMLIVLVSIVVLPLIMFFTESLRSTLVKGEELQAVYMAYSGVYYAIYKYRDDGTLSGTYSSFNNMSFQWSAVDSGGTLTITSTGYSGRAVFTTQRTIVKTYAPSTPTVITDAATGIGTTTATLNMTYDFKGEGSGDVRFGYKQRGGGGAWTYTTWTTQSGSSTYAEPISGLSSNKWHDFYAQLRYSGTEVDGAEESFRTAR